MNMLLHCVSMQLRNCKTECKIQVCLCIDGYLELRRRLMKTVFFHGLGQTAQDWKEVVQQLSISDVDCPELFSSTEDEISYSLVLIGA